MTNFIYTSWKFCGSVINWPEKKYQMFHRIRFDHAIITFKFNIGFQNDKKKK